MTVNELIADLQKVADDGHGDALVQIEEEGLGYFGALLRVDTLLGPAPWTLTLVSQRSEE